MSNVNIDMCGCCGEVWNRDNQKHISLEKHSLHLCPECYHGYVSSCNEMLDKIRAEIETDLSHFCFDEWGNENPTWKEIKAIIDKYKAESEG